ncbi:MAG TPA: TatD family hydrolase [bacterium]|jgi:TatD DNase family protein|nr:TatD family hydrolase [bacterium]HOG38345.1 TatD family hydrolase [bacterium]HQI03247.1 TatD family hydrolase [bacterium]
MLIDTHAHLNFKAFEDNLDEVVKRCEELKMSVINVGAQYETSKKAVEITKYKNFYASLGLHPIHVFDEDFVLDEYKKIYTDKVLAIGETGLDYFHSPKSEENNKPITPKVISKQIEVFEEHIKLAKELDLPLILHGRNSKDDFTLQTVYFDIFKILENHKYLNGVFHCFSGSLMEAKTIIDNEMYIGFTGIITYPNAQDLRDIVNYLPLDRILIETDSPYLAPQKYRGKTNEPIYVEEVARQIAEIKNLSLEKVIDTTWENAKKLFKI